jgi:uncharacterized membrane protein YphA (DoxX/SURF4 family)
MALVLLAARCLLICVFLRAGFAKVTDLADFKSAVTNYRLLPAALVPAVALTLPFAELAAAVLLAFGILPGIIAGLLAILLLTFAAAIAINLARGRSFDCGCAGSAPQTINWAHVASNVCLAALAVAVAVAPPTTLAVWPGPSGLVSVAIPRGDALPIVLAVILGLIIVTVIRRAAVVSKLSGPVRQQADATSLFLDSRGH